MMRLGSTLWSSQKSSLRKAGNSSTAYYDFKEFDTKILLAGHTNGEYIITALDQNGEVSNDFAFPSEIIDVKSASKFFVPDSSKTATRYLCDSTRFRR